MDLIGYINEARSVLRTGFKAWYHTALTRVWYQSLRAVVGRTEGRRMYPFRRPTADLNVLSGFCPAAIYT